MKAYEGLGKMALRLGYWLAPVAFVICLVVPESTITTKAMTVFFLASAWSAWLYTHWNKQAIRWTLIAIPSLVILLFLLPARPTDSSKDFAQSYVNALKRYDGVTYVWGGESALGLDCSGLVRRAMMDACWTDGIRKRDGGLLRLGLSLWLHDCSAQALGEGYRDFTKAVTMAQSINALNHEEIRLGDLAVLSDGIHVMAYVGNLRWIQADPSGSVHFDDIPSNNSWFKANAKVVRWSILSEP